MSPLKRFFLAVFLIFFIIGFGSFGFMTIENWSWDDSIYMTVLTISTVGFSEVHPLSREGRYFMILLIVFSLLTIGYIITTLMSFLFEGHFIQTMKERRMKHFLGQIKDHYIICGFGDVGKEAAREFMRIKVPFVVVDKNVEAIDKSRYPDVIFIEGDASEEEILEKGRILKAKGFISCLPEDPQNVFTVLTARQMNSSLNIVAKASDERTVKKLEKAGADRVISPSQIAGRRLASVSVQPAIVNFLDVLSTSGGKGDIRIESVKIHKGSSLIGKSLKESNIGQFTGAIIIGILNPEGEARINESSMASLSSILLQKEDKLIALGNEEQISLLNRFALS
ncbi:MAG: hypothetical protein B6241_01260 [Spirochaetaceae bacterium 4572_59]|nr:MAG: hypothetical protein B6241_01260 [Spirochaetaceae bacterium 4572_59]